MITTSLKNNALHEAVVLGRDVGVRHSHDADLVLDLRVLANSCSGTAVQLDHWGIVVAVDDLDVQLLTMNCY